MGRDRPPERIILWRGSLRGCLLLAMGGVFGEALSSLRSLWTTCISVWRYCTASASSLKILFTSGGVSNPLFLLAKSNKSPPGEKCNAKRHFSGNSL